MGLTGSVVKFVARYHALKDEKKAAEVVQTAALSIAVVMAVLIIAVYPLLDDVLSLAVPAASMPQALSVLPWAVFSLWLGSVGGVFQSGLDGCQRMDIRNILMIVGNVLFLGAALWLVPHYGLVGLAVGQAAQGLLLVVAGWLMLRRQLNTLPWFPIHWSKAKFKVMFGYSVNFQISSIAILFFESITKLLMSRYGGLFSAGYYEMASQLVIKLRAVIISATQVLVPAVAELHESAPEKVRDLYLKAYRMVFFVAVPYYAAILISLPVVSAYWIGCIEAQFLLYGAILVVGWGLNNLISPAYFLNLGTGDLKWNTISHVLMAILNVLLGLILGHMLGGLGVAISAMSTLIITSALVIYHLHKHYRIPLRNIIPPEHYLLLVVVIFCIAISTWINASHFFGENNLLLSSVNLGAYLLLIGAVVWVHPYKKTLFNRF